MTASSRERVTIHSIAHSVQGEPHSHSSRSSHPVSPMRLCRRHTDRLPPRKGGPVAATPIAAAAAAGTRARRPAQPKGKERVPTRPDRGQKPSDGELRHGQREREGGGIPSQGQRGMGMGDHARVSSPVPSSPCPHSFDWDQPSFHPTRQAGGGGGRERTEVEVYSFG